MRILITNDDGINAPGLKVAEQIATDLAGPDGEVWVVAPALEQSGVSHCISYVRPMRIEEWAPRRFAIEGSPADCVLAALGDVMKGKPPDLVLSGVNRGHNVAEDTLYSGTIGGAMEAAMHGCRAIAMSQYYGPDNVRLDDAFQAARTHGARVCRALVESAPWHDQAYGVFYNINFPPRPADKVSGTRATFQGHRPHPSFGLEPQQAPNGRRYLWLAHGKGNGGTEPGSDAREALDGAITVTPLRADLTARDVLDDLSKVLDDLA